MVEMNSKPLQKMSTEIDFRNLILTLAQDKKIILGIAFIVVFMGFIWLLQQPTQYQSHLLIQVENKNGNLATFDGLSSLFDKHSSAAPSDIQKALINSSFILEPVVNQLNLDIEAMPRFFPIIGKMMFYHHDKNSLKSSFLGLSKFAWGGEIITVKKLDVPSDYLGKPLKLVHTGKDHYVLLDPENNILLKGIVGKLERSNDSVHPIRILISQLKSNDGCEFILIRRTMQSVLNQLSLNITIKDLESNDTGNNKTGILELSLKGKDRHEIVSILNSIANVSVAKDTEYRVLEASKTLEFLNNQLPEVKKSLSEAETTLNQYRVKNGKLNLSIQTHIFLNELSDIEKQINQVKLKKEMLLNKYTTQHPFIIELTSRNRILQQELKNLQNKFHNLPTEDQMTLSLLREVKVKNELYLALLKKIQELQVVSAGTLSNIRILAWAKLAERPLSDKKILKMLVFLIMGCISGCFVSVIRRAFHRTIHDPRWIENHLNIPVVAIVPYSTQQKKSIGNALLSAIHPYDLSIESLRSLRIQLQFMMRNSKNNIICILGAKSGIGKTFIASNFASVISSIGKKILLIDTDLRRGNLNQYVNVNNANGLSEFLSSPIPLEDIIKIVHSHLHVIVSGAHILNSLALFEETKFNDLLLFVSQRYDYVVFDTPPVLSVADSIKIAQNSGINLLVMGNGAHPSEEIEFTVKLLHSSGVILNGAIFNNIKPNQKLSIYGQRYYYEKA